MVLEVVFSFIVVMLGIMVWVVFRGVNSRNGSVIGNVVFVFVSNRLLLMGNFINCYYNDIG